jgi:hypothetical protein
MGAGSGLQMRGTTTLGTGVRVCRTAMERRPPLILSHTGDSSVRGGGTEMELA